jgi:hypothetical protein
LIFLGTPVWLDIRARAAHFLKNTQSQIKKSHYSARTNEGSEKYTCYKEGSAAGQHLIGTSIS